jgi:glycerophosphoryl diester phosphodiesterase
MLLIAHRGSSGTAPENTLAAFRQALRDRADMIELDVRLSADGEPVVIHDRRLYRTTGVRGNVREWAVTELEELNAGARFGRAYAGERIPRLATVLQTLPPTIGLNMEAKTDGDRRRAGLMVERLGGLLRSTAGRRDILVSSFDHAFLRQFHRRFPDVTIGVLYYAVRDFGRSPARLARRAGGTVFICSRAQVRTRWIQMAHAENISVLVYGVKYVRQMIALRNRRVDGVITDYPARLRRALHPRA